MKDDNYHFICYSSIDGKKHALNLYSALNNMPNSFRTWIDVYAFKSEQNWDQEVIDAIKSCKSFIFIITPDSVQSTSNCMFEWKRAIKYKKPITLVHFDKNIDIPFRLEMRQCIDFSIDFKKSLTILKNHLELLSSEKGIVFTLRELLEDTRRSLKYIQDTRQKLTTKNEIKLLEKQLLAQEQFSREPEVVIQRVEKSITHKLEKERTPKKLINRIRQGKFINHPPTMTPAYFQNRHVETKLIGDFLNNHSLHLMMIVGRAGIGKTSLICRLFNSLEKGRFPDDHGLFSVNGIIYLSEISLHKITVDNIYTGLCQLLPEQVSKELRESYQDSLVTTKAKIELLLDTLSFSFQNGKILLLLDNFEDKLDSQSQHISDSELNEVIMIFLNTPHHPVKTIVTTRIAPSELAFIQPGRQARLDLDRGLAFPYAQKLMRDMDIDGKVGLKFAKDKILKLACQRTSGYPRAIEALFAILSADRDTSLEELLEETEQLLPENVINVLVGEAYSRLDYISKIILQALSIYARPVSAAAIDYLIKFHLPTINSKPVLKRLVNMKFARKENKLYYLHPIDREYIFKLIPPGEKLDREKDPLPFTLFSLFHQATCYFKAIRLESDKWTIIDNLEPQLAEFDMHYAGHNYDEAARVLMQIDRNYLLSWGYYRLVVSLHEKLKGKLSNLQLIEEHLGNLGLAYWGIGKYEEAKDCYEKSLELAHASNNQKGECQWLGAIAMYYTNLGNIQAAIHYSRESLRIARSIGDYKTESLKLFHIGHIYFDLGQTVKSINYYQKALTLNLKIGDKFQEAAILSKIGSRLANLGKTKEANLFFNKALNIADAKGYQVLRSITNIMLANMKICNEHIIDAIELCEKGIEIADGIEHARFRNFGRVILSYIQPTSATHLS